MKILKSRFLDNSVVKPMRMLFSSIGRCLKNLFIDLMADAKWLVGENSDLNWLCFIQCFSSGFIFVVENNFGLSDLSF